MGIEVFKLFGSIMVDNEKANESIKKTDKNAEGLGSKFMKGIGTAAKWGAAIGAAAGAGAIALGGVALKAANTASEIERLSQTTGMTTDEFQRWDGVMKKYGYSMEQASGDLAALGEKAMDAAAGVGEGAELFGKLGVQVTDSSGALRSQQDIFNDTITALQGMGNETERNAIASALLSTTGEELVPVLNMTAEELEKVKGQSTVIDGEQIEKAREFKNSWENIKGAFEGIITKIGLGLMPMFQVLFDWINTNMPTIQAVFDLVFKAIEWGVTFVSGIVTTFFTDLTTSLSNSGLTWESVWTFCQEIWDTFVTALKTLWDTVGQPLFDMIVDIISNSGLTWESIWTYCQDLWNAFVTVLKTLWDTIGQPLFELIVDIIGWVKDIFTEYWPLITEIFNTFVTDAKSLWDNNLKPMFQAIGDFISNVLAPTFEFIFKNIIGPAVGNAFKYIKTLWSGTLKPVLEGIIDFITGVFSGNFEQAFEGIGSVVSGVFEGMKSAVRGPLNYIIEVVNGFIAGLNQLKVPDWIPLIGGNSVNIPLIPYLAKGTDYFKGGMAIVGEQGPELVHMGKGASVTPNDETERILNRKSNKNTELKLFIDGREFARALAQHVGEETAVFNLRTGLGGAY